MVTQAEVSIVAVPFPAHGHLNQLLHFSLLLSSRGLPVGFASSAAHNRQAQARVQGWHPDAVGTIRFHDLLLPDAADFDLPAITVMDVSDHLRAPIADLLRSVSSTCRRLIVVHDPLMSFAGIDATSSLPNAEAYSFPCLSAFVLLGFYHGQDLFKLTDRPRSLDLILAPFEDILTEEFLRFVERRLADDSLGSGMLINTTRALDGEFVELLDQLQSKNGKKIFAIGPLHPIDPAAAKTHECLRWLDKQPPASVVYVSFGTTSTLSGEQIEQLATGLRLSGQRFIWVLRDADLPDASVDDEVHGTGQRKLVLPPGFEEEVEARGVVLREFAPQLEILAHASTGGFVSHCGWNSVMESLSNGVPMMAWPMHTDQPKNAMMVTEYLKAGVTVREWSCRKETVSAAKIEESIRRVLVDEEGKGIRKRAKALGEAVRLAVSDGGSSRADLDSFISHVTRA